MSHPVFDHVGPCWPLAIAVGGLLWVSASWSGSESTAVGDMRTPGLLLAAGGAAVGIIRVARWRIANAPREERPDDER
jgi:hypothetical protein